MNQELGPNQQRWLAALRSGTYKQGKDYLCQNGHYCCLGVAAEMFKTDKTRIDNSTGVKEFDGACSSAPSYVVTALGLFSHLGHPRQSDGRHLAQMNDNGASFGAIADRIEADPGKYFQEPR